MKHPSQSVVAVGISRAVSLPGVRWSPTAHPAYPAVRTPAGSTTANGTAATTPERLGVSRYGRDVITRACGLPIRNGGPHPSGRPVATRPAGVPGQPEPA